MDQETNVHKKSQVLLDFLYSSFKVEDEEALQEILKSTKTIEVKGGEYLMRRGDEGDSMYLLISGRLVALVPDAVGKSIVVGEIARGESVGEMAMINEGATRTADIYTIRDSTLLEIHKTDFDVLVRKYPEFLLQISRLVVSRLQNQLSFQKQPNNFVVFSLFKADESDEVDRTIDLFIKSIEKFGVSKVIDATFVDEALGQIGISNSTNEADMHRISVLLNQLESEHDYLLLITSKENDDWSQLCLRHSDYSMVVVDTTLGKQKRPIEQIFDDYTPDNGWNVKMLLVHPSDCKLPNGTLEWYENRKINGHHHVRAENASDISRIARIVCGRSNGLVLSGGGAKGMAHVGVYKALEEQNIKIDYVCGTSIGSIMAALIAMDMSAQEVSDMSEQVFMNNPTPLKDFNLFPFYGLLSGKKINQLLQDVFQDIQIEDLWVPYFCVSSDLTSAKMRLHEQGPLWKSIRASISLPGVFPPVIYENHVLVDGVVFNNIPVDIITKKGVGNVIGVNLDTDEIKEVNVSELPSFFQRWSSKIMRTNKYENLPNMMETIAKSTFAMSENQSRDHFGKIDLFFSPPVYHFGLMDWKSFHKISDIGYNHAFKVLEAKEDLDKFRDESVS